jgi:3-oxoacyl-[acyl-carrier-protein] synthase III
MRIASVQHALPGEKITNEWVRERLLERNRGHFSAAELSVLEARVTGFLEKAGTRVRYRLGPGEKAIEIALRAGRQALSDAGVSPGDVDFLIYAGVGRGWVEPAMASVMQAELGLSSATCFDVLDACASWLRALHIAHTFLRSGTYRRGMIVNCECGFVTYRDWYIPTLEDLDGRLAGWTIGEAATATIVTNESRDDDFHFTFRNFGEHFDLCVFPLPMAADFLTGEIDPRWKPMQLFAASRELLGAAARRIVEVFEGDAWFREQGCDIGFGHAASERMAAMVVKRLGLPRSAYFPTHERYGNTVSASVPLGMSVALAEGRLWRGARVLVVVGASGITVGLASFTF